MDVAVFEGGTAAQKARGIVAMYPMIWSGTVVDVGCRSRELEDALEGRPQRYVGVDINPDAEVVADLGDHLPFGNCTADVVTAFDVLEHTDDLHHAFAELCRVARQHVVITLPNCYEVGVRIRHLRGHPISAKYGLPIERPTDRHRWFFSLTDAHSFVEHSAAAVGWHLIDERATVGPGRARAAAAVRRWPNLLSQTYLALLAPA